MSIFRAQGSKPQEAQNQKRSNTTFTQQSDTTENNKYSKMPENLKELSSGFLETKQNNKSKAFQKMKINKYTWKFKKKKGRLQLETRISPQNT